MERPYQSCITPMSPRSYITGNVFGPLVGTIFITQQSICWLINAEANLPLKIIMSDQFY